jgi:hypothetical protein
LANREFVCHGLAGSWEPFPIGPPLGLFQFSVQLFSLALQFAKAAAEFFGAVL